MSAEGLSIFKAEDYFASELREAKRKGFELQIAVGQVGVRARLVPLVPSTVAACHAIGAGSFEARCPVPEGENGLDAMRDVIRAVLDHAAQVLA